MAKYIGEIKLHDKLTCTNYTAIQENIENINNQ